MRTNGIVLALCCLLAALVFEKAPFLVEASDDCSANEGECANPHANNEQAVHEEVVTDPVDHTEVAEKVEVPDSDQTTESQQAEPAETATADETVTTEGTGEQHEEKVAEPVVDEVESPVEEEIPRQEETSPQAETPQEESPPQEEMQAEQSTTDNVQDDVDNTPGCPSRKHVIKCAAQYLDTNGNDYLERAELQAAIDSLPWLSRGILSILGSVDKMMAKCDVDGDDAIGLDYDMKHNSVNCLATCFKRRAFKAAFFAACEA